MKKTVVIFFILISCLSVKAQEGHKLNVGLDMSLGMHYFNSDRNNPIAGGFSLGYEYNPIFLCGIEAGFKFGGFKQKVEYNDPTIAQSTTGSGNTITYGEDIYRGIYYGPYISPKIYIPIGYNLKHDRMNFLFIENRFSCINMNLDKDKITDMHGSSAKFRFQYEIRGGYQFGVSDRWAINCWLGYNSFDFSKINPEVIRFKNSTPIQIGIGFNYILSHKL